jgi:hypothetical protein
MVTSVQEWLSATEETTLPSGKVAQLRQLDVLSLVLGDGNIPNFLLRQMMTTPDKAKNVTANADDIQKLIPLLNKLTQTMFAEPCIVETEAEAQAGKGICLHHVEFKDKLFLLQHAMGGALAVQNAATFPAKSAERLDVVPAAATSGGTAGAAE